MDAADSSLIQRCKAGDAAAWDEAFALFHGPVTRFIWQVNSSFTQEDVEEIAQETFITMVRSLDTFQGQSQLQTWLFRIAANKAHDYRERHNALKRGGGQTTLSLQAEDPETGLNIDPPSRHPSPDEQLLQTEAGHQITEALRILGDPCREILELRYFADLSYEEIAATLQLNPKTVSSRLSKCLDKLEVIARERVDNPEASPPQNGRPSEKIHKPSV